MDKCAVDGCPNAIHYVTARLCEAHYARYRRGERGDYFKRPLEPSRQRKVGKPNLSEGESFDQRIHKILVRNERKYTVEDLSNTLDCGVQKVRDALSRLQTSGHNIEVGDVVNLATDLPQTHDPERIDIRKFKGREVSFGLTGDNHLCSRYSRLDVLGALFDIWEQDGISTVYVCGNWIDGEAEFNRHDLLVAPGFESQIEYFLGNWPRRKGITSKILSGDDHEGWYTRKQGIDVGRALQYRAREAGRDDIVNLGYMEHDVIFQAVKGACKMKIMHGGGGSAYAISYTAQKIVESFQGGEKPGLICLGHFHKAEYSYPREVSVIQCGTTMDQSPFMRKRRLQAMVGGWTVRFTVDSNGIIHDLRISWHPFYDRNFYRDWKYLWPEKQKTG